MIVVTTPTGNIGSHVVRHLLDAGEALRVIVRDAAKLAPTVRERVEVVEGSHADSAVVDRALRGADAVFWLCPPTPAVTPAAATTEFSQAGAEAIRRHGVRHVVAATTLGRDTPWQHRAGMVSASLQMVDALRETGAVVRGLALPAFMDNALGQLDAIRNGAMYGVIDPDRKLPHTAARDAGAVAARWLIERDWDGQADVPVLGPEALSYRELAAIVSDVLGREVVYRQVPFEAMQAQCVEQWHWPEAFARGFIEMLRAKDEGMDNVAPRATAVIGPTHFRAWVADTLKPALAG